jgi:hypothetical protein
MSSPVTVPAVVCANCSASLSGEYCAACGQKRIDPQEWSIRHWANEVFQEVGNFDSKVLRSVSALFLRPGFLTREWLDGRRVPYISPLRLYLIATAIFFFLSHVVDFNLNFFIKSDKTGRISAMVDQRAKTQGVSREVFIEHFDAKSQTVYSVAVAFSVLSYALILRLLYRARVRWYGQHLVFALHYLAFVFVFTVLLGFVNTGLSSAGLARVPALLIAIPLYPYLLLSLRYAYGEGWGRSAVKAAVMQITTAAVDIALTIAAMIVTFRIT